MPLETEIKINTTYLDALHYQNKCDVCVHANTHAHKWKIN